MLVWLASYPRSGNTFLRVIFREVFGIETYSLYDETEETCPVAAGAAPPPDVVATAGQEPSTAGPGEPAAGSDAPKCDDGPADDAVAPEDHDQPSPLKAYDVARFADRDELHIVKTHHLPFDDRKAIYILRDGRESIASYFHYMRDIEQRDPQLASVIAGLVTFGGWSDHVRAWDPLNRIDTLLLRFERLVDDPIGHLPLLAEFLGRPPVGDRIPTFEELHRAAPKFFRSGRTDSWRTQFSAVEQSLIEALHGDVLAEFGYPLEARPECHTGTALRSLLNDVWRERQQLHELAVWQGDELRRHQMILADASTAVRKLEESLNLGRAA